ncbi:hypothetical protein E4U53_005495 [Claviceps sorghi]|nr:hypothetical protein E4U53_005495 [Claviceps sorghi]
MEHGGGPRTAERQNGRTAEQDTSGHVLSLGASSSQVDEPQQATDRGRSGLVISSADRGKERRGKGPGGKIVAAGRLPRPPGPSGPPAGLLGCRLCRLMKRIGQGDEASDSM